jgi:radical SAM superfamily enzyme YgiQ (UPF0313 family)
MKAPVEQRAGQAEIALISRALVARRGSRAPRGGIGPDPRRASDEGVRSAPRRSLMPRSRPTVALVGRCLPHNENLGLAYLRAALDAADVASSTHFVNDAHGLARAAAAILAAKPDVVGLSLMDGGSALLPLALGEALARAGYRGHVTAGGPFATLARAWLLERYPWLDSVVRHAGEAPLVAIAERASRGEDIAGVPGVTTRAGDGAPSPVLDTTPIDLVPRRDELPEILGHAAAHLTASRGCKGRCAYCGPAALQAEERREGERAGHAHRALSLAGVGGVRRRALEAVCEEMATLFHERGVRYFYFVDEHLLPYDEADALAYLAAWREGLRARDVGAIGIGAMLRADRLTPRIARAFAEVGLVRAFVGLELATPEEARTYGRTAPGPREIELLEVFRDAGVTTVSNLMLVHPESTLDTVEAGLALLERLPAGVFEATKMQVYHGTRLHERLEAEGRVSGNPLRYAYAFRDEPTGRLADVFTRLRAEAFWDYSIAYRTHDAHLALALARRVHPERVAGDVAARLEAVRVRVNALYVSGYRRAIALVRAGGGFREAGDLAAELAVTAKALERELEAIEALLLRAAPARSRLFSPMRAAAASALSFAMVTGAAACGGNVGVDRGGATTTTTTGTTTTGTTSTTTTTSTTACKPDPSPTEAKIKAAITNADACFSGSVGVTEAPPPSTPFSIDASAGMVTLRACDAPGTQALVKKETDAAAKALADACIETASPAIYAYVTGAAHDDGQKMVEAITAACQPEMSQQGPFVITLDATGAVAGVTSASQALADCVKKALAGLSFPCLAGFDVCPEFAIAE